MMDCIQAQELVSAALDGDSADNTSLEEAKAHCRTCTECSVFVKTLVALRRAPLPEPPADLVERTLAAVGAERARAERASTAIASHQRAEAAHTAAANEADTAGSIVSASDPETGQSASAPLSFRDRIRDPRRRPAMMAWFAAAAVVLVSTGVAGIIGVRTMFAPQGQSVTVLDSSAPESASELSAPSASPPPEEPVAGSSAQKNAATGSFIVVSGTVYRAAGTDTSVTDASLSEFGTTVTSIVSGSMSRQESVLGTGDPTRVFIKGSTGEMLAFDRVTTSYEGRTYVLQSGELSEGAITLPDTVARPSAADGYPTFKEAGSGGTGVYVLTDRDASSGIAYPPGAKSDLSGDWTWWLPAPQ